MTDLLEKAFEKAQKLSAEQQDALAQHILAYLESELRWDDLFSKSQDTLEHLAEEALAEHLAGKTIAID